MYQKSGTGYPPRVGRIRTAHRSEERENQKMNTIHKILSGTLKVLQKILLFILIIIGLWFSYNLIFHSGKDQCGIVGNRVDIGAPVLIMRVVNGKPDRIHDYTEWGETVYDYDNISLFGHPNSSICYSNVIFDIRQIHASVPIEEEDVEELLHRAAEGMKKRYETLPNYSYTEKDDHVVMESRDGACSFTIKLTLLEDHLSIDIVDFR